MASLDRAPYAPQDVKEISSMIAALEACSRKGKGGGKKAMSSKKTTFEVSDTNGVTVDSWRFQEWDYKRRDLPTYARGLFTYKRKDGTPEIATRGYDKFFNVGEVHETQWQNVGKERKVHMSLALKRMAA